MLFLKLLGKENFDLSGMFIPISSSFPETFFFCHFVIGHAERDEVLFLMDHLHIIAKEGS